jgi:hypothetical protein
MDVGNCLEILISGILSFLLSGFVVMKISDMLDKPE